MAQELAGRAEQREVTRLFNERFATAAGQHAHDRPAVRRAGVYAMAGLADDRPEQRQTCVDVLCAYLRMPYEPEPAEYAPADLRQVFRAGREVLPWTGPSPELNHRSATLRELGAPEYR